MKLKPKDFLLWKHHVASWDFRQKNHTFGGILKRLFEGMFFVSVYWQILDLCLPFYYCRHHYHHLLCFAAANVNFEIVKNVLGRRRPLNLLILSVLPLGTGSFWIWVAAKIWTHTQCSAAAAWILFCCQPSRCFQPYVHSKSPSKQNNEIQFSITIYHYYHSNEWWESFGLERPDWEELEETDDDHLAITLFSSRFRRGF